MGKGGKSFRFLKISTMNTDQKNEEFEARITVLETKILELQAIVDDKPRYDKISWHTAAKIWFHRVRENITYKELSVIYQVKPPTVAKICTGSSPAEKEYTRQTGVTNTDTKEYNLWLNENYKNK
jgi:hypothetical protein